VPADEVEFDGDVARLMGSGEVLERATQFDNAVQMYRAARDFGYKGARVHLRLGKSFEEGGVYAQRLDKADEMIYLTSLDPGLSTSPDFFLKKEIVDVSPSDITRIEGPDFVVEEVFEQVVVEPETPSEGAEVGDGEVPEGPAPKPISLGLKLQELRSGYQEVSSALTKLKSALNRLEFNQVYPADAPQVQGMSFSEALQVDLKDTTGYVVSTAEKDGKHFLSIQGFSTVDRIEISPDESEEDLKEKADTLSRADEIVEFNAFHGSWVYEIEDRFSDKLKLRKADLMEK